MKSSRRKMKMPEMISISCTVDEKERLTEWAIHKGMTRSTFVRFILKEYLENKEFDGKKGW